MPASLSVARVYRKPPITEAIIDFRVGAGFDQKDLRRAMRALSPAYPQTQRMQTVTIEPKPDGFTKSRSENGYRLAAADGQRILLVMPSGVAVAHLAPYPGWEVFRSGAMDVVLRLRKTLGVRALNRMSVRYINRIDIPAKQSVESFDYIKFGPLNPGAQGPTSEYFCKVVNQFSADGRFRSVVQSGTVASPLMNTLSLLLDIDVLCDRELPGSEDGIVELLDLLRGYKNTIFEDSITDKARALFQPI